jgi:hypothetical protein
MTTKKLQAQHVHAGDTLVIRGHAHHISEAAQLGQRVTLTYDVDEGRVPLDVGAREPVHVRTDVTRLKPGQSR